MNAYFSLRGGAAVAFAMALGACGIPQDDGPPIIADGVDRGPIDGEHISQHQAAIAIDPDGCHTWIVDDGAEGYMSRRHDPNTGLPVCTDIAPPGSIVGDPYRSAPHVPDIYR